MSATIAYTPCEEWRPVWGGEPVVYIVTAQAPESPLGRWLLMNATEQYPGRRIVYQQTTERGEEVHDG